MAPMPSSRLPFSPLISYTFPVGNTAPPETTSSDRPIRASTRRAKATSSFILSGVGLVEP